jgi:alpha-tubulin suppressor-like RCC1 family protein
VGTLAVGMTNACVIRSGVAYCWGADDQGQIGNGLSGSLNQPPTEVVFPKGVTPLALSAGDGLACAIASDGVYCWGTDYYQQAGTGSMTMGVLAPGKIYVPADVDGGLAGARAVAAGSSTSCAVTSGGRVFCFGNDTYYLCADDPANLPTPNDCPSPSEQNQLPAPASTISLATTFACAIVEGAGPECWGNNTSGQLGKGAFNQDYFAPQPITGLMKKDVGDLLGIAISDSHGCAIVATDAGASGGAVYCWGSNATKQLGDNYALANPASATPIAIKGLESGIVQIASGGYSETDGHSCALTANGNVLCWGRAASNELGSAASSSSATPRAVMLPGRAVAIGAGGVDSCALLESNDVYCWGDDQKGQLGDALTGDAGAGPSKVPLP